MEKNCLDLFDNVLGILSDLIIRGYSPMTGHATKKLGTYGFYNSCNKMLSSKTVQNVIAEINVKCSRKPANNRLAQSRYTGCN